MTGFSYRMTVVQGGYAIRLERQGHGQTITHDRLCRDGINAITGSISLIDKKVEGIVE